MSLVILTRITFWPFAGALICKVLTGLYTLCERLVLSPLKSSLREPLPCYALIIGNNVLCARIREGLRAVSRFASIIIPVSIPIFIAFIQFCFSNRSVDLWHIAVITMPALISVFSLHWGIVASAASIAVFPVFGAAFMHYVFLCSSVVLLARRKCSLVGAVGQHVAGALFCCGLIYAFGVAGLIAIVLDVHVSDIGLLRSIFLANGHEGLFLFAKERLLSIAYQVELAVGFISAIIFGISCRMAVPSNKDFTKAVGQGFALSCIVAFIFGVLQVFGFGGVFLLTLNPFFVYTERFSASFTDPNSLGVMTFLIVPFVVAEGIRTRSTIMHLSAVSLLIVSLWSGSRSLWLGFGCLLLYILYHYLRVYKSIPRFSLSVDRRSLIINARRVFYVICVVACFCLLFGSEFLALKPVMRVMEVLNREGLTDIFNRRFVFWRMALATWASSPIVGVGFGRFFELQEYVGRQIGIDLGGWRDNANNYYLQILCEQGLLGFSLLVVSMFLIWKHMRLMSSQFVQDHFLHIGQVFVFCILLIVGPHVHFAEVRYAFILILMCIVSPSVKIAKINFPAMCLYAFVSIAVIFIGFGFANRSIYSGLYGIEDDGIRWTGASATLPVCCDAADNKECILRIRALRHDIENSPLSVKVVERGNGLSSDLVLSENRWYDVKVCKVKETDFSNDTVSKDNINENTTNSCIISIDVSSTWTPFVIGQGGDTRVLGVQIDYSPIVCTTKRDDYIIKVPTWARNLLSASPT